MVEKIIRGSICVNYSSVPLKNLSIEVSESLEALAGQMMRKILDAEGKEVTRGKERLYMSLHIYLNDIFSFYVKFLFKVDHLDRLSQGWQ